jgi:hypothetical protein
MKTEDNWFDFSGEREIKFFSKTPKPALRVQQASYSMCIGSSFLGVKAGEA